MAEKIKEKSRIISQEKIAGDVYSMWLDSEHITKNAKPGQFISVFSRDGSRLLPRPISICEINREKNALRIVYRVVGKGTSEFSGLTEGSEIEIMGPLGNGFPLERMEEGKKAFLIGGGIGIPPMVQLAKELKGEKQAIMGYRDELFLTEELDNYAKVYIATEDGSEGTRGNVLDAIRENGLTADVIFACGPTPMLRALKSYAEENDIECWLSLEEKMACGIGACLACVCQSKELDEHSQVHNKRICKDGPVFLSTEIEL
ncbi:dihydroorotate dehydrogenase electron transfer subunit [Robinsoniella peoriensis]